MCPYRACGGGGYFTHDMDGGGGSMFAADSICEMIGFLIGGIFVQFGGRLFRQVIGIPMGTNCAPLLADLFLYSYGNEFLDLPGRLIYAIDTLMI